MKYLIILLSILTINCGSSKIALNKSEDKLIQAIKNGQDIVFQNEKFKESIDFVKIMEHPDFSMLYSKSFIDCQLIFINCDFEGELVGYKETPETNHILEFNKAVKFIQCDFKSTVNFKRTTFKSDVVFAECIFREDAIFQDVVFMNHTSYNKSVFYEGAMFQDSRYYHRADFLQIEIDGNLMFQGSVFHDDCNFSDSKALKYVDFSRTRFHGRTMFSNLDWKDRTTFNNSFFYGDAQFSQNEFHSVTKAGLKNFGEFIWTEKK